MPDFGLGKAEMSSQQRESAIPQPGVSVSLHEQVVRQRIFVDALALDSDLGVRHSLPRRASAGFVGHRASRPTGTAFAISAKSRTRPAYLGLAVPIVIALYLSKSVEGLIVTMSVAILLWWGSKSSSF